MMANQKLQTPFSTRFPPWGGMNVADLFTSKGHMSRLPRDFSTHTTVGRISLVTSAGAISARNQHFSIISTALAKRADLWADYHVLHFRLEKSGRAKSKTIGRSSKMNGYHERRMVRPMWQMARSQKQHVHTVHIFFF